VNKAELINAIANEADASKGLSEKILNAFTKVLSNQLAVGEELTIPGLGSFSVIEKAARKGRNPKTGEDIQIEARNAVKFKAYKALNDIINP
jgi:DNA-binding protein HU-beta